MVVMISRKRCNNNCQRHDRLWADIPARNKCLIYYYYYKILFVLFVFTDKEFYRLEKKIGQEEE